GVYGKPNMNILVLLSCLPLLILAALVIYFIAPRRKERYKSLAPFVVPKVPSEDSQPMGLVDIAKGMAATPSKPELLSLATDECGHPKFMRWDASDQSGCWFCGQVWD